MASEIPARRSPDKGVTRPSPDRERLRTVTAPGADLNNCQAGLLGKRGRENRGCSEERQPPDTGTDLNSRAFKARTSSTI